jgi:hypothetical protein
VEVRRRMIGAVHPYDDPVERGQAGHPAIVGPGSADTAIPIGRSDLLRCWCGWWFLGGIESRLPRAV